VARKLGGEIYMKNHQYNNIGICSSAISFTLEHCDYIELSKVLLIVPMIMHKDLLGYISRENSSVIGIDKLIIDKLECFTNFNHRFYDSLPQSINAIQFLSEIDVIHIEKSKVYGLNKIKYSDEMGTRAKKIWKASSNISKLLEEDASKLYLNFRIKL
jgi:hypothetical protein